MNKYNQGKDYYALLNVEKNASNIEIAASFRSMALATHPEKNKDGDRLALATFAFSEICEAYEVLSTPELKEIYDKYGEELMKSGVPDRKFGFKAGYKFQGNSFEIFEKFFGSTNPFTVALDDSQMQIGALQAKAAHFFDAFYETYSNLTVTCKCTLEEFYYGCQKKVAFQRMVLMGDGKRQKMATDTKLINIKPGMGSGSTLVFKGEGHRRAGQTPSDLVIEFELIPHSKFRRF